MLLKALMGVMLLKLVVLGGALLDAESALDRLFAKQTRQAETPDPEILAQTMLAKTALGPREANAQQATPQSAQNPAAKPQNSPDAKPGDPKAAASQTAAAPEAQAAKLDELARQEQQLKNLEKELDAKLARMTQVEGSLKKMLDEAKELRDSKLKHLIDVYSNMKSKQAAAVLETLDEDIAVRILAGMRGRQAGEILTYVKAEKAAKLSEALTRFQAAQAAQP